MSNNYFNNHHLLSPKSSHLSLSLHPFTENLLERAIYTAPFMVSLCSSSPSLKPLLLRYLTHCRCYLILHIYTGASSELIPKPHAQRFWCDWPEMRPRNAPVWQPLSNSGDAGNAEGGLTHPLCRMAVPITPFVPQVFPWLGFRGPTLALVSTFRVWIFSVPLDGSFLFGQSPLKPYSHSRCYPIFSFRVGHQGKTKQAG